ncbi:MAG: GPW/gp25 family protein [Alphaproteobacteria bacterium]|nr:GPW/gp25 family protein [Alphaproteobacteria bacterium]
MAGMHAHTGAPLDELNDIRQSIVTIVTTPIATRVMRRRFGSHLFDLIDAPATAAGRLRLIAATADAIARWERRVTFLRATVTAGADGRAVISATCRLRRDGRQLEVPIVLGAAA